MHISNHRTLEVQARGSILAMYKVGGYIRPTVSKSKGFFKVIKIYCGVRKICQTILFLQISTFWLAFSHGKRLFLICP